MRQLELNAQKSTVLFPDQAYHHIDDERQKKLNQLKQLSFSRSLSLLSWQQQNMMFNIPQKQQSSLNSKINQFIEQNNNNNNYINNNNNSNNKRSLMLQEVSNPEIYRLSKNISKLYDSYPVAQNKESQNDQLQFIPSEVMLQPIKLNPKVSNGYLPKPRFGQNTTEVLLPQLKNLKRKQKTLLKREDIKLLNTESESESEQFEFTSLKDFIKSQKKYSSHKQMK